MTASHTPNFALQFVWSFGRILIAVSHEPCPHIRRITRGVTQDIDADRLPTRLTVHDADRHRHDRVRCNRDLATRRLRGSVLRYRFTGFCPESCCRTSGMGPAGRRTPGGVSDRRLGARKGPLYRDCPLSAFARGRGRVASGARRRLDDCALVMPPPEYGARARRGFLYLVAIMDWASRYELAWRLSDTLDASLCVEALEEALARCGVWQRKSRSSEPRE